MINPFNIATDGYLNKGNTLSIASNGYLYYQFDIVVPTTPLGSGGGDFVQQIATDRRKKKSKIFIRVEIPGYGLYEDSKEINTNIKLSIEEANILLKESLNKIQIKTENIKII